VRDETSSPPERPHVEVREVSGPDKAPQALARASAGINAATTISDLLLELTRHARSAVGARLAVASLTLGDDFSQCVAVVSLAARYAAWRNFDEPTDGSGIYAEVARTGRPMRLTQEELLRHPAWRDFGEAHDRHPPLRGWLAVPLVARSGRSLGLVQLSDCSVGDFTSDDEARLLQLAHLASSALERIQQEEALRDERDQARTLIDAIRDGVMVTDRDGRLVRVSPSFCEMTGFTEAELIGSLPPFAFWPPEWTVALVSAGDAVRDEGAQEFELVLMRADGTRFPVLASAAPHRQTGGVVTVVKDITHRRMSEETLRQSRQDLATAQRIAHLGSWVYDVPSSSSQWSEEVYRIMGIPPRGGPESLDVFLSRVPAAEHPAIHQALDATFATGVPYRVEHRFVRPDGDERVVLEQAELEYDERGNPSRLMGTVLDVTAQRRAEDAALAQSRRIERLAEDRGRLVADALNAEDRARQRIAEVLHDEVLQELLLARQDIAEAIAADDSSTHALRRVHEGITRAAGRLRESVGELHPVTLTHGGLGAAVQTVSEHAARRGQFDLQVAVDPGAVGVHDRLLLALVREALVNVERHAGASAVSVTIARSGEAIELVVADDGGGMTVGREEEALRQGHIGLASARERVRALEGSLSVESDAARGTRLVVHLPVPD
jgi:PAS domain S-box-containing protein